MATAIIDRIAVYEDRSAGLAARAREFGCADCECVEMSPIETLPAGWALAERDGQQRAVCPDCNRSIGRREAAAVGSDALRAADRLSECADRLTALCRAPEPDEAAIDAAGTAYMIASADFAAILETRIGMNVGRIVQLLTGSAGNLIEPALSGGLPAWLVPAMGGQAHG